MTYIATFGFIRNRGAWFVTEQMLIDAKDWNTARAKARSYCPRGEQLLDLNEADQPALT